MDIEIAQGDSFLFVVLPGFLSEGEYFGYVVFGDKRIGEVENAVIEVPAQPLVARNDEKRRLALFAGPKKGVLPHGVLRFDGSENVSELFEIAVAVFAFLLGTIELGGGDHLHGACDLHRILYARDMAFQLVRVHAGPPLCKAFRSSAMLVTFPL